MNLKKECRSLSIIGVSNNRLSSLKRYLWGNNATLVVSMYLSKVAHFLFSWVLYFRQENVIVQNKIIFWMR
ncbi:MULTISPECIES: hypothetical protein [Tenebrionibacter/Tenebrionicola group]|uniref:hypothetical protein n=1 Tax=Tenebrionibacter/Tenebrionicola group TaxID=2969848 RepID=UPI0037DA3021